MAVREVGSKSATETQRWRSLDILNLCRNNVQRVADQYNIQSDQLFDSISAALDSVSPDFAIDVTPPKVHEPAAIEIFAAGGFT